MRGVLVIGLIHKDFRVKYEETKKSRKFTRKRMLVQEMEDIFSYRRQKEDADGFIKKIYTLVEKLIKHSWDKETLKIELLTHCCND